MVSRLLINGELVDGAATLDVVNPATGRPFARAARADAAQADLAIRSAASAFAAWSRLGYAARRGYLLRLADAMDVRSASLSRLLTQEQGKPLVQAEQEVLLTIATLRWFAEQELGPHVLQATDETRVIEQRYPQGVIVAITPWNHPLLLLMHKLAPALITGNPVIAKPAPTTPLTTLMLGEIAAPILPEGVFQTIVDANDLGPMLTSHAGVAHVSFTGSTPTGKRVLHSTADTLKRFTLELGGNDAAVTLDDADLADVVPKVYLSATLNSGQICCATKRIYAPRRMYDRVCDALVRCAHGSVVGDGLEQETTIGPIQNRIQYEKLLAYLEEAHQEGTVVAGGQPLARDGYFIPPTIVRDLSDASRLVREEQFGPILPVLGYEDADDVIDRVNDSDYGLCGTVWTSDVERGIRFASRIESGTVWINQHLVLPFEIPYGGAKQSGLGRHLGLVGMEEFTQVRVVNAALA